MPEAVSGVRSVEVVDSHTEGEPTRVVISGWPQPEGATMLERREALRRDFDALRRGVVCEPRGHDAIVGALLTPPVHDGSAAGVIFFNDVGYLGMCGHGLIGVTRTLEFLGRMGPGKVRIDTPVGTVGAELAADGTVTVQNVPARRHLADVEVDVPGVGRVKGDVAYGGNWFFIAELDEPALELANRAELTRLTTAIRDALIARGVTGTNGALIDHIELGAAPTRADADSRNFVLCPGAAYDRSPCGTGTSAKMAALHARGVLAVGTKYHQESITGSLFTGWLEERDGELIPFIRGSAYVTSRATLLFDPADPFRFGFPEG
ncbi:MAG TPA: proline racemase family protein [Gemmatimonadaceae bacterium]|jgi:proline racemase|nr:proline racemase family protein [Gemmatimonadaceae bacterium]